MKFRGGISAYIIFTWAFVCFSCLTGLAYSEEKPFVVMLDPGHGGKPERCSDKGGAHWDPEQKAFLNFYRFGAANKYKGHIWTEQSIVMWLARKIRKRFLLLDSKAGVEEFAEIVKKVTGSSYINDVRNSRKIKVLLSRDNSYLDHPKRKKPSVNRFFRLFDSPQKFPFKEGTSLEKGRLSKMAEKKPELTICLHVNGASTKNARGLHCLFVPSYGHFEKVRQEILGKKIKKDNEWYKVNRCWFKHTGARSRKQWMYNDTWTYFTGYGSDKSGKKLSTATNIGSRHQDLSWRYKSAERTSRTTSLDPEFTGLFWQREASAFEAFRREGGYEGYGGDNLYTGMELVRYTKQALWRDFVISSAKEKSYEKSTKKLFKTKKDAQKSVKQYLGPVHRSVAADWAVPLFGNAVTAFLELGYITNKKDFAILRNKLDVIADGITIGIFSLVNGLKLSKDSVYSESPKGRAVNWNHYKKLDKGNYFEEILL